jgi:hypothetical protein
VGLGYLEDEVTPDQQLAESTKYSSALRWFFTEPRPGLFALFDHEAKLVLLTEDWDEVLTKYRQRPTYTPPAPTIRRSRADNTARILAALAGAS